MRLISANRFLRTGSFENLFKNSFRLFLRHIQTFHVHIFNVLFIKMSIIIARIPATFQVKLGYYHSTITIIGYISLFRHVDRDVIHLMSFELTERLGLIQFDS